MTRSIDHIVACHTIATSRRAAGRPIWDRKIDIKSIIDADKDNESPEHVVAVSKKIAAVIRAGLPKKFLDCMNAEYYDSELDWAVEEMEACSLASLALDCSDGDEPVDVFNSWLETIYNWADINRVWLGK